MDMWTKIAQALKSGEAGTLCTVIDGWDSGATGYYDTKGAFQAGEDVGWSEHPGLFTSGTRTLYIETLFPRPILVIFGGGHVAVPVAQIGKLVDFDVVVNDDRAEFARRERFPQADLVLAMSHEEAFNTLQINSRHYVVIVTRGHLHDRDCLVRALSTDAAYIGVIGSKKKAAEVNQWLLEQGYTQKDLNRIFCPIGLDINAQTPEEIAVSILAEVTRERSKRPAPANLGDIAEAILAKPGAETWALATIVDAFGSTPRGIGARMLIKPDGTSIGTVGGGPAEKEAETIAHEVISAKAPRLAEFKMDNTLAAEEGAICGGCLTMFIQPIMGTAQNLVP